MARPAFAGVSGLWRRHFLRLPASATPLAWVTKPSICAECGLRPDASSSFAAKSFGQIPGWFRSRLELNRKPVQGGELVPCRYRPISRGKLEDCPEKSLRAPVNWLHASL